MRQLLYRLKGRPLSWNVHCEHEWRQSCAGRRYGWWLCINGKRVADINYWVWDSYGQFWHLYRVYPFHDEFQKLGYDPNRWAQDDVSIESRYVTGLKLNEVMMGRLTNPPEGWHDIISLRFDDIPLDKFADAVNRSIEDSCFAGPT